jgi:hypothetical protein
MPYPKGKPRKDLIGEKFGRLTVVEKTDRVFHGNVVWKCVCDCGTTRYVPTTSLQTGNTQSCGCLTKDNQRSAVALPSGQAAFNRLWKTYFDNSKKLSREFSLSKEEFRALTSSDCYYCGAKPTQVTHEAHFNGVYPHNGIDRIDSSKGYTAENTVACCKTCNIAKHTMSQTEFRDWIIQVYNHIGDI